MYAIFAGSTYYPSGGWDDFISVKTTIEDALEILANKSYDWWQIVDLNTMKVVKESDI